MLSVDFIVEKMKLRIQTLTGETQEVEAEPQNSILDLKVCVKERGHMTRTRSEFENEFDKE